MKKVYPRGEKIFFKIKTHRNGKLTAEGIVQGPMIPITITFENQRLLNLLIRHYQENALHFYGDLFIPLFRGNETQRKVAGKNAKSFFKKSLEIMSALLDDNLKCKNLPIAVKAILPETTVNPFSSWSEFQKKEYLPVVLISHVFEKSIKAYGLKIIPHTIDGPHNFYEKYVKKGKKALSDPSGDYAIKRLLPLYTYPFLRETLIGIQKTEPERKDLANILLKIIPA